MANGLRFLAFLAFAVCLAAAKDVTGKEQGVCGQCRPERCPKLIKCIAGITKDRCGCCDVCALKEGEVCDHPQAPNRHVKDLNCGENLECRLRDDLDETSKPQGLCLCKYSDILCGSDGQTYESVCQLSEKSLTSGKKIRVQHPGPCRTVPVIVTGPKNVRNTTGSDIYMSCEAKGFPIPTIEWTWTNANKETIYLPSDDLHVSVNSRGGPDRFEVTGWLQIMNLQELHQGDYACLAQNALGINSAKARVNVVLKQEL
ncbi:insulin-like growth factor-binding protein-related protein 1 [Tubulanus polymorphus]|uniref:insulin-like growth factor-binding protein-related protein 1 n=1 Tax=Tubulanus polymorphus TaxID=672921 RepID=UPI003DA2DB45